MKFEKWTSFPPILAYHLVIITGITPQVKKKSLCGTPNFRLFAGFRPAPFDETANSCYNARKIPVFRADFRPGIRPLRPETPAEALRLSGPPMSKTHKRSNQI